MQFDGRTSRGGVFEEQMMLPSFVAVATALSAPSLRTPCCYMRAGSTFEPLSRAKAVCNPRARPFSESRALRSSAIAMLSPSDPSAEAVLGVSLGASPAELKAAYRERAKQCHPDVNPTGAAAKEFQKLTEASAPPCHLPQPALDRGASRARATIALQPHTH